MLARLQAVFLTASFALCATLPAAARTAQVKVLIAAPVADTAQATMSPALWAKIVAAYVNALAVPFSGAAPAVADCRKAGADFLVTAPFELRPRLPGMPNSSGRVAARTRLTVINCITGATVFDQAVNFDSDPPSAANAGDFESAPEITWARNVPATLAKYPVFFPRVARVLQVTPPFAFVDATDLKPGDQLRVYAGADHQAKGPILLTVIDTSGKLTQVTFSTLPGAILPERGDYIEPVRK